jgi:hypothetical protein
VLKWARRRDEGKKYFSFPLFGTAILGTLTELFGQHAQ